MTTIALAIILATVGFMSPVGAQEDDDVEGDTAFDSRVVSLEATYVVDPENQQIDVTETITIRNVRSSTVSGNTITSYFWTGHNAWLPTDAEGVTILSNGGELTFEQYGGNEFTALGSIDFPVNLEFGQTRVLDISYSIPSYVDPDQFRRVNTALLEFGLVTCCNFEDITLRVEIPATFAVEPPSDYDFERTVEGDAQIFTYTQNEIDQEFTEFVFTEWFARDDNGRSVAAATTGGPAIFVSAPPDIEGWPAATADSIGSLVREVAAVSGGEWTTNGLEFVLDTDSSIGVAGFFGSLENRDLRLENDVDLFPLALTFSNNMTPEAPFEDDWVTTGWNQEVASEALRRATGESVSPRPILSRLVTQADAFWMMHQVAESLGHDGVRVLFALAESRDTVYPDDGPAEPFTTIPNDWRRFVDLAERSMGAADIDDLFREWVLGSGEIVELDNRNAAIATYDGFVGRMSEAGVPTEVRIAMSNWDFDRAEKLMAAADDVLLTRETLERESADLGTPVRPPLPADWKDFTTVESFEAAALGWGELRVGIERAADIDDRLAIEGARIDNPTFQAARADDDLAYARTALQNGDVDVANTRLDAIDGQLAQTAVDREEAAQAADDAAARRSLIRNVAIAAGVVLVLLALAWFAVRRRRSNGPGSPDPTAPPEATSPHAAIDITEPVIASSGPEQSMIPPPPG